MPERVQRLISVMNLGSNEALLVYDRSNIFYLSGYLGEGLLLVSKKVCAVITDFRYTEQAEKEAPGFMVLMTNKEITHIARAAELCTEFGLDTLYYEEQVVSVRTFENLKKALPGVKFLAEPGAVASLRSVKDERELAAIEKACTITGDAFERVLGYIKEGMTEKEIALFLDFDMMSHGASKPAFSTIVAAGAHGSLPHAVPGEKRISKGDMITMDFGARFGNYCADMTRTVAFGEPSEEMKRVYRVVLEAQKMSQDSIRSGMVCSEIDAIARRHIYEAGYEGRFGHSLGHSVGIDIHEMPGFSMTCSELTRAGQVITVEPGVYLPGVGGVRIENTVVVTENGCRALTTPSRELVIL